MAKRKRGKNSAAVEPVRSRTNGSAAKLAINSYEDVPDSEDEFHLNRDKILLDEAPDAKRRRKIEEQDAFLEPSDEEVFAYSDSASGDDGVDSELDDEVFEAQGPNPRISRTVSDLDDSEAEDREPEDEPEGWGPSKSDYYDADQIETEQDALDEEAEARRIQQKQLKALKESDFGFDEDEWLQPAQDVHTGLNDRDNVVTEILPHIVITDEMSTAERLKLLKKRYPEFEPLSKELLELQPLHEQLAQDIQAAESHSTPTSPTKNRRTALNIKFQALSAYLGSIAMYFAILSSTAEDANQTALPLPPSELREHDIMASLVQCRDIWSNVQNLKDEPDYSPDKFSLLSSDPSESAMQLHSEWSKVMASETSPAEASSPLDSAKTEAKAKRRERLRRTEESLAALSSLTENAPEQHQSVQSRRLPSQSSIFARSEDLDSDVGDEPALAPHETAEKARKRNSLRFYTSQIAQKASKRANAGRETGGDDDLPYRERFRDRQIRLNEQAEKRGRAKEPDVHLSDGEAEETNLQRELRAEEAGTPGDQYTQWLEERNRANKAQKQAEKRRKAEAYAAEHGRTVVEHVSDDVGPDGRRHIGYTIEKNKGLTPRRKKEAKNPRVKKRMKYEEKKKKLGSIKPIFKGGEGRGGYGGELTGIKKGLVRSVKL